MKSFLQGQWFGHPLHSLFVHLPVALWPAALVFDLISQFRSGDPAWPQAAFYAMSLGLASAALALPTGLADGLDLQRDHSARKWGQYHLILTSSATGLWVINFSLRVMTFTKATSVPLGLLGLSVLGTVVILVGSYLGGRLVYGYGVGVARASKGKGRHLAQVGGAHLPPE